jgi:hypothetical protein
MANLSVDTLDIFLIICLKSDTSHILILLSSSNSYTGKSRCLTKFLSIDIIGSIYCEQIEKTDLNRNTRLRSFKKGRS